MRSEETKKNLQNIEEEIFRLTRISKLVCMAEEFKRINFNYLLESDKFYSKLLSYQEQKALKWVHAVHPYPGNFEPVERK